MSLTFSNHYEAENIYACELKKTDKGISEHLEGIEQSHLKAIIVINFADNCNYLLDKSESLTVPIVIISKSDGEKLRKSFDTLKEIQARFITQKMRQEHIANEKCQNQETMPTGCEGKITILVLQM